MEAWNEQGFFKETDSQFCSFIKAVDYANKNDKWIFIDQIKTFRFI